MKEIRYRLEILTTYMGSVQNVLGGFPGQFQFSETFCVHLKKDVKNNI